MCGIAGTTFNNTIGTLHSLIKHRGPDSTDIVTIGQWGLCLARLAITGDHTDSAITQKDGNWLLFNGELFGYPKEQYKTDTRYLMQLLLDSKDILETVRKKIKGQFAFAYWSEQENALYLGRDVFGERPLYYYNKEGFSFASEAKALLPLVKEPKVRQSHMSDFIETEVWLGGTGSAIEGIDCIPIGSIYKFKANSVGDWILDCSVSFVQDYFDTKNRPISTVNNVGEAIYKAIWERSDHGNKDVGVYLSGGLDSSLIAMICRPKHVFTCAFHTEIGKRELRLAEMTAKRIGAQHHIIAPKVTKEAIEEAVYFMDGPQGSISPVADFALAKEASKYVKVVLNGQGADELFCGYFRDTLFYMDYLFNIRYKKYQPLMNYYFNRTEFSAVNQFIHLLKRREVDKSIFDVAEKCFRQSESILKFVSLMELTFTLPTLVQMGDRAAAHVGIESRSPFLDDAVFLHAISLPDEEKISIENGRFVSKKALRTIARGLVADEIIDCEEKCGLHVPVQDLFQDTGVRGVFSRTAYANFCKSVWEDIVCKSKNDAKL